MSVLDLSEEDWDAVFALAERCRRLAVEDTVAYLQSSGVPHPLRAAVLLQLELGEPPEDPARHRAGERVGQHIRIRSHLREGGAGSVYLGLHEQEGRHVPVAIKMLRVPQHRQEEQTLRTLWEEEQRLLREFSGLGHIPDLIEAGEHRSPDGAKVLYLCTEYKHGLDLRSWCNAHSLSVPERLRVFIDVCDAVSTIHHHGLVHGDLKPENIQVQSDADGERVWVLDLGLATIQGQRWAAQGELVGSPGYMSPEQISEQYGAVCEASDVYALGMILFELLEGKPWLDGRGICDAESLWRRIQLTPPPQLLRVSPPALRSELETVLRRATRPRPEDRYIQVSALREALRKTLSAVPRAPAPVPESATWPELRWKCGTCDQRNEPNEPVCVRCGVHRSAPREQRKHATVLFTDLESEPQTTADFDFQEPQHCVESALRALREIAHRYQGTYRLFGSGMMALFGAPLAHEDHAVQACLAAVAMRRELQRSAASALHVRIGIHSGELLLRGFDGERSTDYDALGEVPAIGRRLSALAGPDEILISGDTYRLVEGYVEAVSLGSAQLRGVGRAVEMFEVRDRSSILNSWKVRASRRLTEFVERDAEMALLIANLDGAARGERHLVEISGEAGVGKSRLAHELAIRAQEQGWRIVRVAAHAVDAQDAYATLARLLRIWLEVEEQERQSDISSRLERHLAGIPGGQTHLCALQSLLELPVPDEHWHALEPSQRRMRIVAAIRALGAAATAASPLLVIVDDLHWVDPLSLSTLEALGRTVRGPLLLLVSYRPEHSPQWSIAGSARIHLAPLSDRGGARILDLLMGSDASLRDLKRKLCERSAGNPLFLEESVRGLLDAGVLTGASARLVLEVDAHSLEIPASIQNVVASRVDRLEGSLRHTLQTAAVIGRQFSADVLRTLRHDPSASFEDELEYLIRLGFLYSEPGEAGGEGPYRFGHPLVQQIVYQGLPDVQRRDIHARIVDVIEQLYAERLSEHVGDLAEHALAGGRWGTAARYRLRSCTSAIDRAASREAVALFEQALASFARMPPDETAQKAAIDLRLAVINALLPLGDHQRLLKTVREAETLAEEIRDERRLGLVCSHLSTALWLCGQNAQALTLARKTVGLALQVHRQPLYLGGRYNEGVALNSLGLHVEAIQAQREVLRALHGPMESVRSGWSGYPAVLVRSYLAQSYIELGRLDEARECIEYGTALADRVADPFSQAMIRSVQGDWLVAMDRSQDAIALLEPTVPLCLERTPTMYPVIAATLAAAHRHRKESERALAILEPALTPAAYERSGQYSWIELFLVAARVYLDAGNLPLALQHAVQVEELCRRNGAESQLAYALQIRADLAATLGGQESPEVLASEAAAIAHRLGMPLVRCR